ncbi:ATP-grasp domain-containing protein [Agrobacterium tumefaciens]|uniref:ATP-grasp domain-containing protein n=1 Tax=Agrobacterium tumefaciens TaxID=358 RepID=A0AA44F038_AGRTU|nr:ATP-grasp domain-containing protein [Agrobacterium tumefaciens]NSL23071.1 ATP-grasp domain-containing protein [Agrobacterium tumefaciens]NTB89658.1 ATP-grasp domain-containing protein [Agrobacterium tumefaciens]NTC15488.1 ATP-grasp domain-containing protein [Agrobacterium tumefaciens]NTC26572.1 ATP-grasp domain-containing protein [Agrobacterium tumefaciens]NTC58146.1 ATP-grasp domain-containing protein [Agrobacterium tumefaciens]
MDKIIAVIESSSIGTSKLLLDGLLAGGYTPLFLSRNPGRFPFYGNSAIRFIETDTNDEAGMLRELNEFNRNSPNKILGVTSAYDYYMPAVAFLADALGLPGQKPEAARYARHKHNQKEAFAKRGLPLPAFQICRSATDVEHAALKIGFPVVCKPVSGAGSMGVKKFDNMSELLAHAVDWLQQATNYRGIPIEQMLLVEKFVSAPEISVEVFNGRALALTDKYITPPPIFLETGHQVPAKLISERYAAAMELAEQAVAALDLTFGCCHVEMHVLEDSFSLIEVNQRIAGDLIPLLVREAFGIDMIDAVIKSTIGAPVDIHTTPSTSVSRIGFLLAGEVDEKSRSALETVSGIPNVVECYLAKDLPTQVEFGDPRDRVGYVVVSAQSASDCEIALRSALKVLTLKDEFFALPHNQAKAA